LPGITAGDPSYSVSPLVIVGGRQTAARMTSRYPLIAGQGSIAASAPETRRQEQRRISLEAY
jgi:hypothetical protein